MKQIPIVNDFIYFRAIENCIVIVDAKNRIFHRLNKTGSTIFKLIDGNRTVEEIIAISIKKFNIPAKSVKKDCLNLFSALNKKDIVTLSSNYSLKKKK